MTHNLLVLLHFSGYDDSRDIVRGIKKNPHDDGIPRVGTFSLQQYFHLRMLSSAVILLHVHSARENELFKITHIRFDNPSINKTCSNIANHILTFRFTEIAMHSLAAASRPRALDCQKRSQRGLCLTILPSMEHLRWQ